MRLRIRPRFCRIVIAVMVVAFGVSYVASRQSLVAAERELAEVNARRQTLLDEVEALSAELEFARTDEYVIRIARDELGMLMPGEVRYVRAE